MEKLAIIYDENCLLHKSLSSHPERPERLETILDLLRKENFLDTVKIYTPEKAEEKIIELVHPKEYFDFVKKSIEENKRYLDPDTYIVKDSWNAALLAAGGAVKGVDLLLDKNHKYIFNLMRPPGHHAETGKAMGFCIFNNAAIAARYALTKYGLQRIAIIDWDVHHGNGTQEIFYTTSNVYFFSIHQWPLYPGTGTIEDTGLDDGKGYNKNFPVPPGTDGYTYIQIFEDEIIRELEIYKPQMIILSAGFDAHKDDPLANINLIENDFKDMTILIKNFADERSLPILSFLEGGYNLDALSKSVYKHLQVFNS
jgi:acetoin utilization deacetylase AcuC-like enzyme